MSEYVVPGYDTKEVVQVKIREITADIRKPPALTKVAAYARVSSDKDAMHHSLSAQVSYYSDLIQKHKDWQYAGVYADEAKTGTKDARENFQRLLADCRAGKIDMVITKSVSRFARNTVTLLETVRELKLLGIDVYFEEQNIHTVSAEGELMLTILASYAQEESLSASENQKWRVKRNFENGIPWNGTMLGYRMGNGRYETVPKEAEVVKRIFSEYLSGKGVIAIIKGLNKDGIPTRLGNAWGRSSIMKILQNYAYTGNLLLQKTFRENHLTKRTVRNNGELPKYHAEGTHEAIIDLDTYNRVQEEIVRRAEIHRPKENGNRYPFTSLIVCGNCGKHYRRKQTPTGAVWICATFNTLGKEYCASKQIPEETLTAITADIPLENIACIRADKGNRLTFVLKDGNEIKRIWKDRSRSESWTEEMREKARQKAFERNRKNGKCNSNSGND